MDSIEGLRIIPLKKVENERGHLMEVQRADDPDYPGFGQVYVTCTLPGTIKAWYRHHQQFDQISLIKGKLKVALYDSRGDSRTHQTLMEVSMAEENPLLLQIPPGVWHGFKALGDEPTYLVHLNTVAYNFEETDEDRLPPDTTSIPYRW